MITLSGEGRDVTAADGILFNDDNLIHFQVVVQCVGKPRGETVDARPDDDQVFFIIVRQMTPKFSLVVAAIFFG
jgi:hypothetical protein